MSNLRAPDTISGREGYAYAQIDGNNEELFYAKKIEATIKKTKSEIKSIGKRLSGFKTTGAAGSGSMTLYYVTSLFRDLLADWKRDGCDSYFSLLIVNDDIESSAGQQAVLLMGVNLNSTVLTSLDGDSDDVLDEKVDFTFENFHIITPFKKFRGGYYE